MSEQSERDTHFAGFAKLLYDELGALDTYAIRNWNDYTSFDVRAKELIAQRAYDLLYFLLDNAPLHSGSFDVGYGTPGEIDETIERLPDMNEWPKPRS